MTRRSKSGQTTTCDYVTEHEKYTMLSGITSEYRQHRLGRLPDLSHTKSIHYYKCSLNDRLAILLYHFVVGIKSTYVKTGGRVASASSPLDVNCTRSGNNVPPTPSSCRMLGVVCENAVTAAVICECH